MGNTTFDKETEPEGTDETIMWIAIGIAAFFGIFPHYLMDPISVASYDILDFMGVI